MALLVHDEQLEGAQLLAGLKARGMDVKTIGELGATGRPDPDMMRKIAPQLKGRWVFVTMDTTIVEDYPGFDWSRYTIAWIMLRDNVRGIQVEREKTEIMQRHAHVIRELATGAHHTFTATSHRKSPPSLNYLTRSRA